MLLLGVLGVAALASCHGKSHDPAPAMKDRTFPAQRLGPTHIGIDQGRWLINGQLTFPGRPSEGLLINVRMVNSVFEDDRPKNEWPAVLPQDFDPEANTDAFIARLPEYVAYGMLAFTINLQGGLPGYEGAHNSAFNSDGSLRRHYMDRVKRVIEAADNEGAVIILGVLYQRQHHQVPTFNPRALDGRDAIRTAITNVASWVKEQEFTNVILEISNEFDHHGFRNWRDGEWLHSVEGQVELIHLARAAHPPLRVSTSSGGSATIPPRIAEAADYVLIHTNNTKLADYAARILAARQHGKPVVINEDNKVGQSGARAAQLAVENGAGWGLMLMEKNQFAPFEFRGAADDAAIYNKILQLTSD